jgi:hypothetical protein
MSERDALEQAIKDGVVSKEQAEKLTEYMAKGGDPYASQDPENLSFLSSLNDVFLTIGLVMLMFGMTLVVGWISAPLLSIGVAGPFISLVMAGVCWMLAEYFTRRRRLLLPSMALATGFCFLIGTGIASLVAKLFFDSAVTDFSSAAQNGGDAPGFIEDRFFQTSYSFVFAFAAAAGAFYYRFKLPFAMFLIAISGAIAFYQFMVETDGFSTLGGAIIFIAGLVTLAVAMFFDSKDATRRSRI